MLLVGNRRGSQQHEGQSHNLQRSGHLPLSPEDQWMCVIFQTPPNRFSTIVSVVITSIGLPL
jgi:hypothetical protein